MTPPGLDRTSALFHDFDGTLVEIAATPKQVVVPPGLPDLLAQLYRQLGGRLLRPFSASGAGEHGVSLRYDDGTQDIDPSTGEPWGNFPQTYSQVGLILSAMRQSRSWEESLWHAS